MQQGPATQRHHALDALRGVAVLGIFAVNIMAFGFPWQTFSNPGLLPQFKEPAGQFWQIISTGFFFQKFITIFSALFGAGIVLMLGEEKPSDKIAIHRRRMFWLLIIGIVHAYFLWFGDILVPYAIAGFIVAGARRWRSGTLLLIGGFLIGLNFLLLFLQSIAIQFMSPEDLLEFNKQMWAPPAETLAAEAEKYRGGFFERLPDTIGTAVFFQFAQTVVFGARTIGVMMLGMALFKSGFFTLQWRNTTYLFAGAAAALIGAAGSFWGAHHQIAIGFDLVQIFPAQAALYWASLVQAFGYAALMMFLCSFKGLALVYAPFSAAGRMALSNYLACTLIGVLVFYGPPGAGNIGALSFSDLARITGLVWLAILIWSPLWLSLFRFGPMEWLWRSLTYQRFQPLLK